MGTLFTLNYIYVERHILSVHAWRLVRPILVATGLMAVVVFVALRGWGEWVRVPPGVAVYAILIVGLKAVPTDEWLWLRDRLRLLLPSLGRG